MYVGQPLVGRVLWMLLCLWTAAPVDAAQFHLTVVSAGNTVGATAIVPIVVTAEAAVGAAQWELLYDPATLRWAGGSEGPLAVGTLIDANVIEPGRAKIAFAGGDGIKGTGEIYRAEFEWIGKPLEPTGIRFATVRAWDQSGGLELSTSAAAGNALPPIAAGVPPDSHVEKDVPAANSPDKSRYLYIAALVLLLGVAMATLLRKSSKR